MWFFGYRHIMGITKDINDVRLGSELWKPVEQAVHIRCGAHVLSLSPNGQPKYNL